MQLDSLRRAWLVLGLSALLILAFNHIPGRGEPARPTPAPDETPAAVSARQAAEELLLDVAARAAAMADAQEQTRQAALAAASRLAQDERTTSEEAQAKQASSRGAALPGQAAARPGPVRVPILMYHHVANAPPDADAIRRDLSVSPAAFTQQMDYLSSHGYQTISLADLAAHLQNGSPLPAKPVVLTFDDGYDDNYSQAYPILRQHGFVGTFFLITDAVGNREYMTWEQALEMSRYAMSIQAHGRTHADLTVSTAEEATWQIVESRKMIEEKIGQPVQFYCYPSGRYTTQTISILRAKGYIAAVTTAYGATHSPSGLFGMARVRIRGADTLEQFAAKVETAP